MSKLRVHSISMSLDGYSAGPNQSLNDPLGVGGQALFEWFFATRYWNEMHGNSGGKSGGETGIDHDHAEKGFENIGAWILGRNMFGPVRGRWPDDSWKGWWGNNPPYHVPVFVLTHHERAPLEMEGGTTFYFVTDGIERALDRAREAAQGKDVRVGGGASTIRQYLRARLIDYMHVACTPTLLGSGEPLLSGIDLPALGYHVQSHVASPRATHVTIVRR
jgi:dihydrofolate reductase